MRPTVGNECEIDLLWTSLRILHTSVSLNGWVRGFQEWTTGGAFAGLDQSRWVLGFQVRSLGGAAEAGAGARALEFALGTGGAVLLGVSLGVSGGGVGGTARCFGRLLWDRLRSSGEVWGGGTLAWEGWRRGRGVAVGFWGWEGQAAFLRMVTISAKPAMVYFSWVL